MTTKVWGAVIRRVIDGDTVTAFLSRVLDDNGERQIVEQRPVARIRLVTLDTPERGEVGWAQARQDVILWLAEHPAVEVETYGRDSLGRLLGDVYVAGDRSDTLTQHMLRDRGWLPWAGVRLRERG